ncbi:MAG: hypothetical protein PWP28_2699 [Oceanotoga sp.]|nr:hypothetical protein [Oceanotoga sp.]
MFKTYFKARFKRFLTHKGYIRTRKKGQKFFKTIKKFLTHKGYIRTEKDLRKNDSIWSHVSNP